MNKGLLEKFSGAAAAYSVRLLNRSYTGPLLKIRRVDSVTSQDNGEIFVFPDNDGWISLDSKVVDPSHTSLATTLRGFLNLKGQPDKDIISSTDPQDAYVVVWKDQSGNANDASQTSTTAQPKLATAGVLVTENGKPAVQFIDASSTLMTFTPFAPSSDFSVIFVAQNGANNNDYMLSGGGAGNVLYASSTTQFRARINFTFYDFVTSIGSGSQYLGFLNRASNSLTFAADSNLSASTFTTSNALTLAALSYGGANGYNFKMSEVILYPSDQSSNRTKIEEDINDAFNIYSVALSPTERSFLGKYPDAAAAYSVRNLTGKSKQPIVKVRRELGVDTDTEETIYADSTGFLDQSQLLNFVNEVNEDPRLPLDISEGYGYSLRTVKAGYTGPLIQVRESGGNTTKDIYADASGNINVEALKTFCGSNDGHVVKWYNQGGVDRTLEADAAANQPKIVEAGVVVRDTLNNVALKFTNAGNEFLGIKDSTAFDLQEQCIAMHFMSTALPASGSKRIIGVVQPTGELGGYDLTIRNTVEITNAGNINLVTGGSNVSLGSLAQTVNSPSILTFNFKGGDSSGTSNKTTQAATLVANDIKGLSVGARFTTTSTPDMLVAEVIQYTSAQFDDNKNEIEASLNKHYQIYGDAYVSTWYDQSTAADDTYLLDSNPGAAAAYSLRKLRENYTGKAINIRRDSDQNHLDIGFTSSGELDVDAIINFCGGANGYVTTWYNQAFNSTNELLLDTTEGQGAEAAYSVRQLSSTATECMIIRRASDSKLRTIGFKDRDIDEAAIESFCKGTSCTVQTWKDQSGNGNDATAPSTGAQPTIYTGGALVKEGGKVAVDFDGVNDVLRTSSVLISGTSGRSLFMTAKAQTASNTEVLMCLTNSASSGVGSVWNWTPEVAVRLAGAKVWANNPWTSRKLGSLHLASSSTIGDISYYDNGVEAQSTSTGTQVINTLSSGVTEIGAYTTNGEYGDSQIQELILYASDKSSDRTSIESNINGYYGIYSTNNATQDAQSSQPQIYSSSTGLVTENGKPAVEFDGSDDGLTLSSLTYSNDLSLISLYNQTSGTRGRIWCDDITGQQGYWILFGQESGGDSQKIYINDGAGFDNWTHQTAPINQQNLLNIFFTSSQIVDSVNGTAQTQSVTGFSPPINLSGSSAGFAIGNSGNMTSATAMKGQEFILYNSDQSNNRLEIEGNINSHYRIYGSNDASQSTSTAQPKLVSAGRVILDNGRPALDFDGVSNELPTPTIFSDLSAGNAASVFHISKCPDTTDGTVYNFSDSASNNFLSFGYNFASGNYGSRRSVVSPADNIFKGDSYDNTRSLFSQITTTTTNNDVYRNGVAATDTTVAGASRGNQNLNSIGTNATYFFKGVAQEIVVYGSDQSSNRTGIESSINSQFGIYWDGSKRGLLDDQPNAAAAYSVRALNSSYTGPVVEIRRDSDGTSTDIYATYNGDLNESAIETFCTGTTCTVATWYDQSGNNNNATQGTALNQPTIYTGGQLVKEGGRLALDFDGTGDFFGGISKPSSTPAETMAMVLRLDVTTDQRMVGHPTPTVGTGFPRFLINAGDFAYNDYEASPTITTRALSPADTNLNLIFADVNDTTKTAHIYKNGIAGTNGSTLTKPLQLLSYVETDIKLGSNRNGDDNFFNGKMQEYIRWDIDRAANRTNIESDINSYYNIYSKLPGDRLLNKFPGAAAAYSLRVLDSLYTGPLVRVRRDSDGVHADVYPDFNREISIYSKVGVLASSTDPIAAKGTTSLKSFMNGANGFVTVWYDQAESNNASQGTANYQPKIYDGATTSVETSNGKPAVQTNGTSTNLVATSFAFNTYHSVAYVVNSGQTGMAIEQSTAINSNAGVAFQERTGFAYGVNDGTNLYRVGTASPWFTASQQVFFGTYNGNFSAHFNGSAVTMSPTGTQASQVSTNNNLYLFARAGSSLYTNSNVQEIILYPSDQSSNRTKIETDINNHYSIYAKQKKLLDAYGGAAAAYSLRRLNSLYTGPLVKIRRDSDNVEVNVYPDFEGNFSLNSTVTNVDETTSGSSQVGFSYTTPYATLSQFVKGNPNCFVVEWKDQSGNGNHATQTTGTDQPKIYDGTTGVVTENGKPAVETDDTPTRMVMASSVTVHSGFFVYRKTADKLLSTLVGTDGNSQIDGGGTFSPFNRAITASDGTNITRATTAADNTSQFLGSVHLGATSSVRINGSQEATGTTSTFSVDGVFQRTNLDGDNRYVFVGRTQEIILYDSAQSGTDISGIEDNINTFYNIY